MDGDLAAELARFEAEISSLPAPSAAEQPSSHSKNLGHHAHQETHVQHQNHASSNGGLGQRMFSQTQPYNNVHQQQQQQRAPSYGQQQSMGGNSGNMHHVTGSMMGPLASNFGMGMGMGQGMPNMSMGMMAPPPGIGATMGAQATNRAFVPEMLQPAPQQGTNSLSVAQIKAMEKQQKAAKDAAGGKGKGKLMQAAGKRWRDQTLDEWPDNDYRIFVGDLGE
jgi:hypothetical protein